MSRFVRHRFMPMAVGYAALRRCHQFECIFLFCLSHLHNDLAIKREYFELLKVFDSICTKFGTSNFCVGCCKWRHSPVVENTTK